MQTHQPRLRQTGVASRGPSADHAEVLPRLMRLLPVAVMVPVVLAAWPASASASTGSTADVTIVGGGLSLAPPSDLAFSVTFNGLDQTVAASQPLDVADASGTSGGWNLSATSTVFSSGGATPHTLPATAVALAGTPTDSCDAGSTCSLAQDLITYPYALPAAASPPPATKLFDAATGTGGGRQTITPTWSLTIPGSAYASSYSATWTITLADSP